MKLSVLMTVYNNDNPKFFVQAYESITKYQTMKPAEVVLVIDGRVSKDLEYAISKVKSQTLVPLIILVNNENIGLAKSLNKGLSIIKNDLVLRMDSDDISKSFRIEKTITFFKSNPQAAMVGSWYDLFSNEPSDSYSIRKVPSHVNSDPGFYKSRTPINHPTITFKTNIAKQVNGYPDDIGRFEDWGFALRFISNSYHIYNISESLLYFRAPIDVMVRRGGLRYAFEEFTALNRLLSCGHINYMDFLKCLLQRIPLRLSPKSLRYIVYRSFVWK